MHIRSLVVSYYYLVSPNFIGKFLTHVESREHPIGRIILVQGEALRLFVGWRVLYRLVAQKGELCNPCSTVSLHARA